MLATILIVICASAALQLGHAQVLQPNTTLNEFKNATLATATADPGDEPAVCTLEIEDLAAPDLAAVGDDCATLEGTTPPPGGPFCTGCGCALNLLAYRTLNRTGAIRNMSDANDDMLNACATWVFQQAVQQGAVTPAAAAALDGCGPIDFICDKAAKQLNTSLITGAMTDVMSVLGGAISDAAEEAAAGALPLAAAAAPPPVATAKSWSAASSMSAMVVVPIALACLIM